MSHQVVRTGHGLPCLTLYRKGTRQRPAWQLVVRISRGRLGGKYIEDLGYYTAYTDDRGKRYIRLKVERVKYWIAYGAGITRGAYHILEVAGLVPPMPLKRKITLGEMRLARYLHEKLKSQGTLKGLPDGIPAYTQDILPGKLPKDEWKNNVSQYHYVGKFYHTHAALNYHNNSNYSWNNSSIYKCTR